MRRKFINNFWKNVERYQKLRHLTDKDIGKALGIQAVSWYNYRYGRTNAKLSRIEEIAKVLEVEPLELFEVWTDKEWQEFCIGGKL
ncbi:helix-turn-helix domain-containing protein [Enterococcus sp.]|uniref:helix-turn-helix domain-containing protein n=1 Tax=Enterococcus sp. TaxID=35783 RepID=UPI003C70DE2D